MSTAIITGASSGLGRAYVDAVIKEFPDVQEIWLIARRKERLEEIARQHPQKHFVILGLDLSAAESYETLRAALSEYKPDIKVLVSNSGTGYGGDFRDGALSEHMMTIDLNVKGAIAVTYLCLPYMNRGSVILEICSVSAFAPTPGMLVYSAGKECLLFFSKGLREELKPRQINVCAVCPGNMNTEMNMIEHNAGRENTASKLPFLDIHKVASQSLKAAQNGKAVCTPGAIYKGYRVLAKVFPHNLIMKFTRL